MLKVCGPTQDILWLHQTTSDLADARLSVDPCGNRVGTGRRQVAALFDLVERAVLGEDAAGYEAAGSTAGDGEGGSGTPGVALGRPSRPEPVRSRELGLGVAPPPQAQRGTRPLAAARSPV